MLIIYTDKNHYDPKSRSYLPDILRPFIPSNRLVEFSLDQDKIAITDNIQLEIGMIIHISFLKTNQSVVIINNNTPPPKKIISFFI